MNEPIPTGWGSMDLERIKSTTPFDLWCICSVEAVLMLTPLITKVFRLYTIFHSDAKAATLYEELSDDFTDERLDWV